MSVQITKAALRTRLLKQRAALTDVEKAEQSQLVSNRVIDLIRKLNPRSMFIYVATDEEVGTRELIEIMANRAITVAVPRIISREEMRAVHFPGFSAMRAGPLGILAPVETSALEQTIDVAIVPGLGFSLTGDRLGFGAGYYDRWFAAHPATIRIGIAFEFQVAESIPNEPHDVKMHYVVTDQHAVKV